MKRIGLTLGLLATAAAFGAAPERPAVESAYPVMCWTYRSFESIQDTDYLIDNWVCLGINRPLSPGVNAKTDKTAFRAFLDKCGAVGLKVYVCDSRIGGGAVGAFVKSGDEAAYRAACEAVKADWANHPAVVGFYVTDEPGVAAEKLTYRAARIQKETMPDKEPFLNLLPWGDGSGKQGGPKTLAESLERCREESGLDFFGYDCYTQQRRDIDPDQYFMNLRGWCDFACRTGTRWNTTLLCVQHYYYGIDSIDDFRWQISTAAAMGASGLCWFYPDHTDGYLKNYRDAPINPFGERTQTFFWMGEAMRLFQHQYGALFAGFTFEKAMMYRKTYGGVAPFRPDDLVYDIRTGLAESPVLLSRFHDAKGARYLAVVNLNRDRAGSRCMRLTVSPKVTVWQRRWEDWTKLAPAEVPDIIDRLKPVFGEIQTVEFYIAPGQLLLFRLD